MANEKQPLTDEEYVAKCGGICPACGSDQIEGGNIDVDGSSAYQKVSCLDCDASWNDVYKLEGYDNLATE